MNKNALNVMRGFLNLTSQEQADLVKELDKYRGYIYEYQKNAFKEEVQQRIKSLGPKNSICECCGK